MDVEHMQNVVECEQRFIEHYNLCQGDLFSLLCALKHNSNVCISAMVTTSVKHAVPQLVHGCGLIYDYFDKHEGGITIVPRHERVSLGEWFLHFNNLTNQCTAFVCGGHVGQAMGLIMEMYNAMVSAAAQYNAGLRAGYEECIDPLPGME